ncbi:MAG: alpha/beta fold hydrolase [Gammaproteobacteria bacterium]|nr:alpha/beta fold hydrolase [Gammaproteobacteria bacterium]
MQKKWVVSAVGAALLLSACDDTDTRVEADLMIDRGDGGNLVARFDPSASEVPSPNNFAFLGATPFTGAHPTDATLNISVEDENDPTDPKVAMNSLDGFSTVAPLKTTIGAAAEASTLGPNTVKLFEVTLNAFGLVDTVSSELVYGVDYVASVSSVDSSGKTIAIVPIKPLKPASSYLAALTTGIQSTDGRNLVPDSVYNITKSPQPLHIDGVSQVKVLTDEQAVALEALRPLTNAQEAALAGQSIPSSSVAVSWVFSTQSIGDVLTAVKGVSTSSSSAIISKPIGTASQLVGGPAGIANVHVGTLTLPYYLSNASSSPADPLSKYWTGAGGSNLTRYMSTPDKVSDEVVPLLVSTPSNKEMKPNSGWPVVMFQHGITSNRSAMLAIAETLASVGFATVAIDLPLHGLAPTHALYINGSERTFDIDLANNATLTSCAEGITFPCPDGTADSSGKHFINLGNLQVTRDNLRQSVADQFALFNALATMDYDGNGADFDINKVYFVGHSLGGMVGLVFAALEPNLRDIVVAMPGGGIAKLLDGSASFGPVIAAGLAGAGVVKGTADYESFLAAAQTLIDSGDPINYTQASNPTRDSASGRGVLMIEVIGDGDSNLPDQVIPNNVTTLAPADTVAAPLSGSDPLFAYLGLTPTSDSVSGTNLKHVLRFTSGDHRSILDPTANATVTTVMQTAIATFLASDGNAFTVSDTSVVQ